MTIGCNEIVACILKNCENLVPGVKDRAFFINYECVDKVNSTFDPTNALILTHLELFTGSPECHLFCVEGYNWSNEPKFSMVKKTFQKTWEHSFVFRIFDNTPEDKIWIENLKDSRFMVVVENVYNKSGLERTVYEILGWDFGLELNAAERDPNSDEMLGGWLLTAGCSDKMKESSMPLSYIAGSTPGDTLTEIRTHLAHCCPSI